MKLVLKEPGFENFTGQMGVVFFENGVSTTDVSVLDSIRMSAVMRFAWEDGTSPSVAQHLLDRANDTPPEVKPTVEQPVAVVSEKKLIVRTGPSYTEEQLAEIADKGGIAELRSIGEQFGIKGNSIRGLIEQIVRASA